MNEIDRIMGCLFAVIGSAMASASIAVHLGMEAVVLVAFVAGCNLLTTVFFVYFVFLVNAVKGSTSSE